VSEVDAAGVPAPAASAVESCSHLANHHTSAIHRGITVSSPFLTPRTNPLASEHAVSRSWSLQARRCVKEFHQFVLARAYWGISAMAFRIYRHK
jgi:hypothetical protein